MHIVDYQNVHQMLKKTVDDNPDHVAYRWFYDDESSDSVTWKEFYDQLKQVAKGLMALDVQKGDKVIILSYSCYKWVLADLSINTAGAATVGIYQSNLASDCEYIINHSDAVVVFAEDETQLQKLMSIRDKLSNIRKVILFNGNAPANDDWVVTFDEFMKFGKDINEKDLQNRIQEVTPQDTATIVYTSGTTGVPKGAVLTHDNMTFTPQSVKGSVEAYEDDESFLFLPLAHVFARTCVYATVLVGATLNFARSMDTIVDDLQLAKPHWFPSVPRIYEKVYSKVVSGAEAKGGVALKIFNWAREVGDQMADCILNKEKPSLGLSIKHKVAVKLVYSKLHHALGGRLRFCISGAAPLEPAIGKFFIGGGVIVLEGLGMTENTSFTNVNRIDNYRIGWVGPPGPGIEQKIAEDGEILFRGRNVMKEYYKMPEETEETFTKDGWLRTGDLGEIDSENFLRVTGRKKELIITAGGKNVAPSHIEGHMATSKYINQLVVIGDRRKYLSALVTLDEDNVKEFAQNQGIDFNSIEDLINSDEVYKLIEAEIKEKNKDLPSYEGIKTFRIVPEFTVENKMMTPTMKVKKNVALETFKDQIDEMYPQG
ncbi:MAG: AMP-dependent synthetase/ligase [Thermodesulfobacteriota bacterium]